MQVFFKRNWIITWVTICIREKEFASAVLWSYVALTHWGRMTHICVSKLTTFGSDNGLSPARRQAIIWTNAGTLLNQTLGTNFSEILRKIHTFSFKKMHMKMSSGKCRPSCLGLDVFKIETKFHSKPTDKPTFICGLPQCQIAISISYRLLQTTLIKMTSNHEY